MDSQFINANEPTAFGSHGQGIESEDSFSTDPIRSMSSTKSTTSLRLHTKMEEITYSAEAGQFNWNTKIEAESNQPNRFHDQKHI